MRQCDRPIFSTTINFCQSMVARCCPGLIPGGLVKRRVSLGVALEVAQAESQMIECFAISRVGVALGLPRNRFAQTLFGAVEFSAQHMPASHGRVTAGIRRVTTQCLLPIKCR